jgi:hypothetical protein
MSSEIALRIVAKAFHAFVKISATEFSGSKMATGRDPKRRRLSGEPVLYAAKALSQHSSAYR